MMSRSLAYAVVVLALLPLVRFVTGAMAKSAIFQPTSVATKAEVLKHVPIGTPIERAKITMEANGFTSGLVCCRWSGSHRSLDGLPPPRWLWQLPYRLSEEDQVSVADEKIWRESAGWM